LPTDRFHDQVTPHGKPAYSLIESRIGSCAEIG